MTRTFKIALLAGFLLIGTLLYLSAKGKFSGAGMLSNPELANKITDDPGAGVYWVGLVSETQTAFAEGKLEVATARAKEALDRAEKAVAPDHPDVATSLNNLGSIYYAKGQYAEAEPLLNRSLAIREKILRANHPDLATSLENLAELYGKTGRAQEAEPLKKRAADIRAHQPARFGL
ncbi:MAG: tetratricopeptide repeat protein [Kiritimatiellia bacterium]